MFLKNSNKKSGGGVEFYATAEKMEHYGVN